MMTSITLLLTVERTHFMSSSIFSYFISEANVNIKELPVRFQFGKYTVLTDEKTPYISYSAKNCDCIIFGLAVDLTNNDYTNIARNVVLNCDDISSVIRYENKLGGKYILMYRKNEKHYIMGDATCSLPLFYSKSFMCTNNIEYIHHLIACQSNPTLRHIRNSGDISQAMPYDVTEYTELKQLLPNHYLIMDTATSVRFINCSEKQIALTPTQAASITKPLIKSLCEYYNAMFKLYCPITSGRDSRVVLAFLAERNKNIDCYTIKHKEHSDNAPDLCIPRDLCEKLNLSHKVIEDTDVPYEFKKNIDELLGNGNYSFRTLQIAKTVNEHYGDGAVINGDIIGQIGKCSLHRDIPLCFATPSYFRCKLHNYSNESKTYLKYWLNEISNSGECVNAFDLFSVENRLGRWAGQENLIYNSIGQLYLNIFNSRSIIYVWTAVPRNKRKRSAIHIELIKKELNDALCVPFEKDENIFIKLSKLNGFTYLLSSYLKYYAEKIKYKGGDVK